jgi:hypothetical protein
MAPTLAPGLRNLIPSDSRAGGFAVGVQYAWHVAETSPISGDPTYGANDEALCKIMKEWTFQDREFGVRVANLDGTGTGTDFENRLNGDYFFKIGGTVPTVFDDGARDLLTGGSGIDWFIFNSDEDKATDLNDEELADALEFIYSEV